MAKIADLAHADKVQLKPNFLLVKQNNKLWVSQYEFRFEWCEWRFYTQA